MARLKTILSIFLLPVSLAILVPFFISTRSSSDTSFPVDLLTATAYDISKYLANGTFTSLQLIEEYLRRIDADNHKGLNLRAINNLVPIETLRSLARGADDDRKRGNDSRYRAGSIAGLPILLKDNQITSPELGLKTTFGSVAFENATSMEDAKVVADLRKAGAIILGKANLDEMHGMKGDDIGNGYSSYGGIARTPYDFDRPCGSSGGSAIAVASGFSPVALGTETMGSTSCPASFNSLFGISFSQNVISGHGTLQTSTSYDRHGIFGKSVVDLAMVTNAIGPPELNAIDIEQFLTLDNSWSEWRVGQVEPEVFWDDSVELDGNDPTVFKMLDRAEEAVRKMQKFGAYIEWNASFPSAKYAKAEAEALMTKILNHEMHKGSEQVWRMLQNHNIHNLQELVDFNFQHKDRALGSRYGRHGNQGKLERAAAGKLGHEEYRDALQQAHKLGLEDGFDYIFEKYNLDAIVVPAWSYLNVWSGWAGAPIGTVPLCMYPMGTPYGLSFHMRKGDDLKLLKLMRLYETTFPARYIPKSLQITITDHRFTWYDLIKLLTRPFIEHLDRLIKWMWRCC